MIRFLQIMETYWRNTLNLEMIGISCFDSHAKVEGGNCSPCPLGHPNVCKKQWEQILFMRCLWCPEWMKVVVAFAFMKIRNFLTINHQWFTYFPAFHLKLFVIKPGNYNLLANSRVIHSNNSQFFSHLWQQELQMTYPHNASLRGFDEKLIIFKKFFAIIKSPESHN